MIRSTLCTYTYNDADLTHGLLDSIADWSVTPDEILVVDDGSLIPFTPKEYPWPILVMRHAVNQRITKAKSAGLSAASGEVIFSVDCDVRVTADYLERCLERLADPSVGMVSGPTGYGGKNDLVSRYLRLFGDVHNMDKNGPVDFIPGNAFALRRSLWHELGGFGGYARDVCEDHALCQVMKNAGYVLYVEPEIRAIQTRVISRQAHCRRIWQWCGPALLHAGQRTAADLPRHIMVIFVQPMLQRIEIAVRVEDLLLTYIDILYVSYVILEFCAGTGRNDPANARRCQDLAAGFWHGLSKKLKNSHILYRLLRADMLALGADLPVPDARPECVQAWDEVLCFADILDKTNILRWLNDEGAAALLRETEALKTDFSGYAE